MVVITPKSTMLKLLIVTELLNANHTLSPFLKNKDDLKNSINDMLGMNVNLPQVKQQLLNHVLRRIYGLPLGDLLKDNDIAGFSKKGDEFVFSFHFTKSKNNEEFPCTVEIRFKKNTTGTIEAYKKYAYDGPSGIIFSDFFTELNKVLLPHACANFIDQLFELTED